MALFDKLKKLFGFGDDSKYEAGADDDTPVAFVAAPAPKVDLGQSQIAASPEMVHMIFDRVVEITNASVPAYLQSGISVEKQKKYLYDALDQSIKDYIVALETAAHDKCQALWQKERDELKHETEKLKQRARDLQQKRSEMKEQNLSSERQKRALSERVHDLEAKLLQLESEKEQLELENHSLINKMKVAAVQGSQAEDLREQLEQLQSLTPDQKLVGENSELKKEVEKLNKAVSAMTEACEAAKVKDAMNSTMLNDLQHRAAESLKASQEAKAEVEALSKELALRDARISDLQQQVMDKDAQIQENEEVIEGIEAIADQMDMFEQLKARLENRIRDLKGQLKEAERDNDTLRTTIKNNLYAHAQQEKALTDQIEQLRTLQH